MKYRSPEETGFVNELADLCLRHGVALWGETNGLEDDDVKWAFQSPANHKTGKCRICLTMKQIMLAIEARFC